MGQTQVDLHHLLEDLQDAYPGSPEETILTEVVANALDSGAHHLAIKTAAVSTTFTIIDDGSGMQRRALARYHDIASSSKVRGEGIGFAGVGIKIGLLHSSEVYTETRRGSTHVATRWHLASKQKAPWKWVTPAGLVESRGTAVQLRLNNVLSPLLDPGFVELALRRHFEPLFDPRFDSMLAQHYKAPIQFVVNDAPLSRTESTSGDLARIDIRLARRRKPNATGHLVRSPFPLPEDARGVAISTLGKVIKRGWDWLGLSPASAEFITGVIEAPELAASLTLNKADFIRTGSRGAVFLSYRKAIQEAVSVQLERWGDSRETSDQKKRRAARPVERDLERVLVDLASDFPLLAALVERRMGGQRKLPMGAPSEDGKPLSLAAALIVAGTDSPESEVEAQVQPVAPPTGVSPPPVSSPELPRPPTSLLPTARGPRRPQKYGLQIQFEARDAEDELGRLVDSTVWVNESHPAYRRAAASRSEGYHLALTVAMALSPLAVEPSRQHGFVTSFLARWGEAVAGRK